MGPFSVLFLPDPSPFLLSRPFHFLPSCHSFHGRPVVCRRVGSRQWRCVYEELQPVGAIGGGAAREDAGDGLLIEEGLGVGEGGADVGGMGEGGGRPGRWGRGGGSDESDTGGKGDSGGGEWEGMPEELEWGVKVGGVGREVVERWRGLRGGGGLMAMLMGWGEFRRRMLADERFFYKLMVQIIIGDGTSLMGEIQVRGRDIFDELEYVAADLIVGTVVEAAFVWLLAPMLALPPRGGQNPLARFLSALPANIFEAATPVRTFTMAQRAIAFVYAALQYAAIGLSAGVVGTAITYGLIEARKLIDHKYQPKRPMPELWANSVGWGAFMALSSNTRFQLLEGVERFLATILAGRADNALKSAIFALRFGNNYWGGVQFVQFFRFLGLHATAESAESLN